MFLTLTLRLLRPGRRRRAPRSTRTATTTGGRPGTRSTSRRWSTGSGRTCAAASARTCSTSPPSNPRRRGAPHFHAAIRGTIPRAELRAIAAATYHQVWWPAHDQITLHAATRLPRLGRPTRQGLHRPRHRRAAADLGPGLSTQLDRDPRTWSGSAPQVDVKGILAGTEEAGRHIGYLTKYLTKSVGQAAGLDEHATDAQRDHAAGCLAELRSPRARRGARTGCSTASSPRAPGRHDPGRCKGKAHEPEHLGNAGRRVLVSRKWSGKTLDDHRAERGEFVRQLLDQGRHPTRPTAPTTDPTRGRRPDPATPTPTAPVLLLRAIAERQRWKAEYTAAQCAGNPRSFGNQGGSMSSPIRRRADDRPRGPRRAERRLAGHLLPLAAARCAPPAIRLPNGELRDQAATTSCAGSTTCRVRHDRDVQRADLGDRATEREGPVVRRSVGDGGPRALGVVREEALANNRRSQLMQAVRAGESFDVATGPTGFGDAPSERSSTLSSSRGVRREKWPERQPTRGGARSTPSPRVRIVRGRVHGPAGLALLRRVLAVQLPPRIGGATG